MRMCTDETVAQVLRETSTAKRTVFRAAAAAPPYDFCRLAAWSFDLNRWKLSVFMSMNIESSASSKMRYVGNLRLSWTLFFTSPLMFTWVCVRGEKITN